MRRGGGQEDRRSGPSHRQENSHQSKHSDRDLRGQHVPSIVSQELTYLESFYLGNLFVELSLLDVFLNSNPYLLQELLT